MDRDRSLYSKIHLGGILREKREMIGTFLKLQSLAAIAFGLHQTLPLVYQSFDYFKIPLCPHISTPLIAPLLPQCVCMRRFEAL